MSMLRTLALALALALASGAAAAGLVGRFGPDGIPFTFDDPLAVGASASPVRYGAFGADACSEEEGAGEGVARQGSRRQITPQHQEAPHAP